MGRRCDTTAMNVGWVYRQKTLPVNSHTEGDETWKRREKTEGKQYRKNHGKERMEDYLEPTVGKKKRVVLGHVIVVGGWLRYNKYAQVWKFPFMFWGF
jgi:hypothetical protein